MFDLLPLTLAPTNYGYSRAGGGRGRVVAVGWFRLPLPLLFLSRVALCEVPYQRHGPLR